MKKLLIGLFVMCSVLLFGVYIIGEKTEHEILKIFTQNGQQETASKLLSYEKQFFKAISDGVYTNQELAQHLCEAYFYLGYWHKISGNLNKAIYYFKSTTASNIHDFIEYKYALIELASIQLTQNSEHKDN